MDTDSDDSERWEDFFGSTTDLTPSILGFYDTLNKNIGSDFNTLPSSSLITTKLQSHSPVTTSNIKLLKNCVAKTSTKELDETTTRQAVIVTTNSISNTSNLHNSSPNAFFNDEFSCIKSSKTNILDSSALKLNTTFIHSHKQYRSFKALSPNVQRIISHSNTVIETDNSLVDSNNSDTERTSSPVNSNCMRLPKRILGKQKVSWIPLTKKTSKLSKAGTDLDKNSSPNFPQQYLQTQTFDTDLSLSNSVRDLINSYEFSTISHKKPTNANYNKFDFQTSNYSQCDRAKDIFENEANIPNDILISTPLILDSDKSTTAKIEVSRTIRSNYNINENLKHEMDNAMQLPFTEIDNKNLQINKSPLQFQRSIKQNLPKLTYAKVKMLDNKSSVQFENSNDLADPGILIKHGNYNTNNSNDKNNIKSTNLLPIKSQQQIESKQKSRDSTKVNKLLADTENLKCRPLSSVSICSTSSSTSSSTTGSSTSANENHITEKSSEVTSYLASVESLADHSEGEFNSSLASSNNTLSVLERSCLEVIDSERSYVEDLRQVIQGYLFNWREKERLNPEEIQVLFSNIESIYEFNTELLDRLIDAGMDQTKISKCFIDLNQKFEVYTIYCTSYPAAISLLTSLLQASQTNALLTSTQKQLQHTLPLGSYLLKPVQRILKYHLLLGNVRKYCDNPETTKAHEIMKEVARNIDQVKRKLEQQNRVKELSGILDGWLGPELTVLGELRLEGSLMENGKRRMIFLFETMLIITKPKEDNRLQFKSYIYRNNLMLTEHLPGEPTSFNVIPYDEPRHLTKLTARNRDEKKLWAQNIKSVIIENLDIPNRAKELVFKLGDEEDRTPDKNARKWTLNTSTPTPVYLERRNQYRRSEIRNRSKMKRKTVTNSSSFDILNNIKPKLLESNRSIDDNFIISLSNRAFNLNLNETGENLHIMNVVDCKDSNNDGIKIKLNYTKDSKSSKHISNLAKSDNENISCHEKPMKSNKKVEVKMYNTKTIPKRIATIKKNRANKKETATFYMDIAEFNNTVLKITESSENLFEVSKDITGSDLHEKANESENKEFLVPYQESQAVQNYNDNNENSEKILSEISVKKDAEIIVALIKGSKDFEKILNKSPRKKSIDNGRSLISSDLRKSILTTPPPPPPTSSSPPFEVEKHLTQRQIFNPEPAEEPVYETLLRNVHVPYKFSPVLNRSKSQQYYRPNKNKNKLNQRPESDYVTLVYDKSNSLENTLINEIKIGDALRNSDSRINYQTLTKCENTSTSTKKKNVSQGNFMETICSVPIKNQIDVVLPENQKSLIQKLKPATDSSFLPRMIKSVDNINQAFKKKPPERRVSDVSEMCRRQNIHNRVGERMAHLDYADPKTIFQSCSIINSVISLSNHQRDSVFSLSSSSDSVSTGAKTTLAAQKHSIHDNNDQKLKTHTEQFSTDFTYEDCVENCLENEFRDSAIFSDDNIERRQENHFEFYSTVNTPLLKKTSFLHNNLSCKQNNNKNNSNMVNLKSPNNINCKCNCQLALQPKRIISKSSSNPGNISNLINNSKKDIKTNKSWVFQQISNFNK
ncbi:uncharacterized protein LOC129610976 isoform X2 [Condylostylus longicornis]|uniref:uncharacterized protein LOC129610976 isoform X2 n=1 Tax=Condylostylus longicornis TaxID=2530218 RepID=UPI00244DCB23|nr:uncharacterized protein LOC129610976 isoform X2 [Condylostylus longicornis]